MLSCKKTFKFTIKRLTFILFCSLLFSRSIYSHDCISMDIIKSMFEGGLKNPILSIDDTISLEEAYCGQEKLNYFLKKKYNDHIGYKVGFTGKALQKRFNINTPATGVLYEHMFLENNSTIKHDFAYRPFIEPDFMVIVKSANIMKSKTPLEILENIKSIHPFMEIPALRFEKGKNINGNMLVAANMLATKMIMGEGIKVISTSDFLNKLSNIDTLFVDQNNNVIQDANTRNLMGNPINILSWLIKDFNERGISLKENDRLSLGAVGKLFPLAADTSYTYKFLGFNKEFSVKININ